MRRHRGLAGFVSLGKLTLENIQSQECNMRSVSFYKLDRFSWPFKTKYFMLKLKQRKRG